MRRRLGVLAGVLAALILAAPAAAITTGQPDNWEHPYVGEFLFYVPEAEDLRFDDPGAWFTCSGTLVTPWIVVTAGHCVFDVGEEGEPNANNDDGTDIWFNVQEEPDFSGLQPSTTFVPDRNDERYDQWSGWLDSSDEWVSGTGYHHPLYDDDLFWHHDLGVVVLDEPIFLDEYGQLPTLNYLNQFARQPKAGQTFEAVGYGLEQSRVNFGAGGDTRRKAQVKLISLVASPRLSYAVFSANKGVPHQGGTCFGDSGGPILHDLDPSNTFDTNPPEVIVAVNSWAQNYSCAGKSGGYRIDQPDDLNWLWSEFGINASNTGDVAAD